MALKKTVTTPFGVEIADAYHRVEGLSLDSKTQITFHVRAYKDESSAIAVDSTHFTCAYKLNESNPILQAYEHAKQQPAFAGATDC